MNLNGKRILITRPRARAQEFASTLIWEGAIPVIFPVIEILALHDFSALDSALNNLNQYDWIVLTSIYGAEAFISRLTAIGIKNIPAKLRVAAVGNKTRFTLAKNNIQTDFIPSQYTSKTIANEIGHISGKHFLLLQSDLHDPELGITIRAKGGQVDEVKAYQNIPAQISKSDIKVLKTGVDIITFTSPSAVKGYINAGHEHGFDITCPSSNPIIACIGPVTARAIRDAGLCVHVEADKHTTEGMIQALKIYELPVNLRTAKATTIISENHF